MTGFEEWFYSLTGFTFRAERCYDEIVNSLAPEPNIKRWMEAAYNQGFQDGYNSPMPPTDFV